VQADAADVDGRNVRPSFKLRGGQKILFRVPPLPADGSIPEPMDLDILHEDDAIVVLNKEPGVVVHPARGHWSGTLTCGLAYHFQSLSDIGGPTRPGIVHRLDRDTSGVILVAKTNAAHMHVAQQFHDRTVQKEYLAITNSPIDRDRDWIETSIGRHPYQRDKMAIRDAQHHTAKNASTFYQVEERFGRYTLVRCRPKTGRTHQIRVHMESIGAPILCDRLYAGHASIGSSELLGQRPGKDESPLLSRQALHAASLQIVHPHTGREMQFQAPLADDLQAVVNLLRDAKI
ncbi:MAG: RluA family pseudouridine synthase, partial [Planctomycetota bacterium]